MINMMTWYKFFYYTVHAGEVDNYGYISDVLTNRTPKDRVAGLLGIDSSNVFIYAMIEDETSNINLCDQITKSMVAFILSEYRSEWISDSEKARDEWVKKQ